MAGDQNAKELAKLTPIVDKINNIYTEYNTLNDQEIKDKTQEFKDRITKGESLDDILPEAFATVKQACKRLVGHEYEVKGKKETWFMIPFDVQLLGWIILHNWTIAEMKTWEGKTIVATMPVYLNALSGKWVHLVTVNDRLASYQAELMRPVYERLWLSVGAIFKWVPVSQRRTEYGKDVTYIENSELWFDFLRDNLVKSIKKRALTRRPLNYAIVDEIDSILIDEARTPLIISEPREEPTEKYQYYAKIVKSLIACTEKKRVSKWLLHELINEQKWFSKTDEEDGDYYIDEKTKTASLSSKGIEKLEKMLNIENLYKDIGFEEIHHIENALRAQAVFEKDKDYIIKNGEILIVDEHTWRTMPWRRFSEGMHQAIEAKENVQINRESKTMATITYQNFFKQFDKLAGMTGTAMTEWEEFANIYELDVLEVTTNKPIIRVDKLDKVYFNQKAKRNAVKEHISFYHEIGQPILIWTSNIATSEFVSNILDKESINHYVLNAKHHEQEANIVGNAGKYKSVVVATNMAWRGTDIKLDKDLNKKLAKNYAKWIKTQLSKEKWTSATIYSSIEFELLMEWLKTELNINNEQIRLAEKEYTNIENGQFKIIFNQKKKTQTDAFAEICFKSTNNEIIEKDFHFWLFILGTEKHESRRIDNQLRGRAGRQGDAGISVFFVALDDLIMRKMWWEKIQSMASMLLKKEELEKLELTQKQFTSSIVRAQKQMEWRHFSIRKHLFDYDSVVNTQRERIYKQRDAILMSEWTENEDPQETIKKQKKFIDETLVKIEDNISFIIIKQIENAKQLKQSTKDFLETIEKEMNIHLDEIEKSKLIEQSRNDIETTLISQIQTTFQKNIKNADNQTQLYNVVKDIHLHYIDKLRVDHIDEMQGLREKVSLMWYAQLDPLIVYKKEAYEKFQTLLYRLKFDTTVWLLNVDFKALSERQKATIELVAEKSKKDKSYLSMLQNLAWSDAVQKIISEKKTSWDPRKMIFEDEDGIEVFEANDDNEIIEVIDTKPNRKTRPNDPCPCWSGKKYKKCCWANK